MKHKRCYQCGKSLPIVQFRVNKEMVDGHIGLCDSCRKEYHKEYYQSHKERYRELQKIRQVEKADQLLEYSRMYQSKNKVKLKKYLKEWYSCNRDRQSLKSREYYQNHKDEVKSKVKEYRRSHPDIDRAHSENRRVQKMHMKDRVASKEWMELVDFYGHKCLCCGKTDVTLTQDHVVPLKLGGRHIIQNLQPLCRSCNSSKHTKIIDYRMKENDTVSVEEDAEEEPKKKSRKK